MVALRFGEPHWGTPSRRGQQARLADGAEQSVTAAMALAEQRQADLELAVVAAVAKERAAGAAAIAERNRAIESWKRAGALAKAHHAAAIAALEQRLRLAGERAQRAERKVAHAAAREQMAAKAVDDFGRRLSVLDCKPPGPEPTFLD
jgi:hypothetical protein